LFDYVDAADVDAVLVSHGHPDHCADLNPLLRCRAFRDEPAAPLPVHALPGALDAVLALDRPGLLDEAVEVRTLQPDSVVRLGPFELRPVLLPHSVPNVGMRLAVGDAVLTYTGDCGPSADLVALADGAGLLLAESSYATEVPPDAQAHLSSAVDAAAAARQAGAGTLVLTHLLPETTAESALDAGRTTFGGPLHVAEPGLRLDVG
jgi:ribonuclease BN (tRNA processing enzyme)